MANKESESSINMRLNYVATSGDTRNLRLPTIEETRRMNNDELRSALDPFLREKRELQDEAIQLVEWVRKEIHPVVCRFSGDIGNRTKAELKEMILELRCLQHDTTRHREDGSTVHCS